MFEITNPPRTNPLRARLKTRPPADPARQAWADFLDDAPVLAVGHMTLARLFLARAKDLKAGPEADRYLAAGHHLARWEQGLPPESPADGDD